MNKLKRHNCKVPDLAYYQKWPKTWKFTNILLFFVNPKPLVQLKLVRTGIDTIENFCHVFLKF